MNWAAGSSGVLSFSHEGRNSMSIYFTKGKGWRYDFTHQGTRQTKAGFKTKAKARRAEAQRKEVMNQPPSQTPTDMGFLELVNTKLDIVKAYNSDQYYKAYLYMARRWIDRWGKLMCSSIKTEIIEKFLFDRRKKSAFAANKDLRHLRTIFRLGQNRKLIASNPTDGIKFFPLSKKLKYIPPLEDIERIISLAKPDTQDYLWTLRDTMARVGELNRLTWDDVVFEKEKGYVVLYTRKKRGSNLTPRKVQMTSRLYAIMRRRYAVRDENQPWVFCNSYKDPKTGQKVVGPFRYRKTIMKTLCKEAGVKAFSYHCLRHAGASLMDSLNVPIGSIQKILGHEHRTTTEIYLHSISEAEHEAIDLFERATQKSHTKSHTSEERKTALIIPLQKS